MQQQTIQDIETQANQLLESVYQRKSESITSYSKLKRQEEVIINNPLFKQGIRFRICICRVSR
ncbi:unnamed protein product [Paramecium octaurelia]|uniref:Uncharacterized protein n=1 Tax=Paramecium octaurelia TaxID=43137 RepID=A0A8S1VRE3_PAROT|nr:unnamed protein product [Paramecium octaurelia]